MSDYITRGNKRYRKYPYWNTSLLLSRRIRNGDFNDVDPLYLSAEVKNIEEQLKQVKEKLEKENAELKKELSCTQSELSDYEKHFKEDRATINTLRDALKKIGNKEYKQGTHNERMPFASQIAREALAELNNPIGD